MVQSGTTKRAFLQASAAGAALSMMSNASLGQTLQPAPAVAPTFGPWQLREAGIGDWMTATVPGTVHTDLFANGKIADPFYRTNERDLQWIDKKDWEYRTTLDLDADVLAHDHIELCFDGLDTYAEVYLNDALVLRADNMFRSWTADIKAHALAGQNVLRVILRSAVQEGLRRLDALGYNPPAVVDWSEIGGLGDKHVSMFVRKAGYHFGWDWGPRFVTSGIWRPVHLRVWNGARIADLSIVQDRLTPNEARLTAVFEIVADAAGPAVIELQCPNDPGVRARADIMLQLGVNTANLKFKISKPKLWWTNGLGEAFLYSFVGRLAAARANDRREVRIGLRTLKIVQRPDPDGTSFNIELNGVPVFMKGANYIPNDSFLPRVTKAVYQRVVQSAVDTNMNMLRVWGGGIYENDVFYDLCDEHGILIWQDFMFACVMYPGDAAFLENVRQEAIENVRRLRNHPCVALWVGNNEIDTAWQNDVPDGGWKWKEQYTPAQRDEMWASYQAIFHQILPQVVAKHDPQRFYWPSSPLASWDGTTVRHANLATKQQSGDIHSWGVWWANRPFSSYRNWIGRFMSEYGFQSFPEFRTVQAYTLPGDYDILSAVMRAHQRSSIGNGTIKTYMERDYKVPADFRQFLYVGQVLQAEGVKVAMEAHRARMPFCMGSLFWQINDCWPVASWSSIDYYGRWKALQYYARKSFAPLLVTSWVADDLVKIAVVNDRLKPSPAVLTLRLMDFSGNVLKTVKRRLRLRANTSEVVFAEKAAKILAGASQPSVFLRATLSIDKGIAAEDRLYFCPVKDLALPLAAPTVQVRDLGGEFAIGLSSPVLVKNLYLSIDGVDGFFSDNYFDLLPNKTEVVHFKPFGSASATTIRKNLEMMHMGKIVAAPSATGQQTP
jgi:beta-mannosidase